MINFLRKKRLLDMLELISPKWSSMLRALNEEAARKIARDHSLRIGDPLNCIVAEAFDFKLSYVPVYDKHGNLVQGCTTCSILSCEMMGVRGIDYTHTEGWNAVEKFAKHFNKEHKT